MDYPDAHRIEEMKEKRFDELKKGTPDTALQLAFDFFNAIEAEDGRHSHSVELFDILPKYLPDVRKIEREQTTNGQYHVLPDREVDFSYGRQEYKLVISPARIKEKDGRYIDYYPGPKERIVEMALRKLAIDKRRTQLIEDWAGFTFTLHELRKELERIGHRSNLEDIKHSIEVLHKCSIELTDEAGEVRISSPIFPARGVNQKQQNGDVVTFVLFHPLIRASIERVDFRQHDYLMAASIKNHLAQYLHTRLVHRYTQASHLHPYGPIKASTIIAGAGASYSRTRKGLERVQEALRELIDRKVLIRVETKPIHGPRGATVDEEHTLFPTSEFIAEQKRANRLADDTKTSHDRRGAAAKGQRIEADQRRLR